MRQPCYLSPLLYILYNNGCQSLYENWHIIKSDDDAVIVIVSLLQDKEQGHGAIVY